MARYDHLPIYQATLEFAIYVEKIAVNFSKAHRYTLGSELRSISHRLVLLVIKANNARDKRPHLYELQNAVEEARVLVHITKEVAAFHSFKSFETCVRHLDSVGKQCHGWSKKYMPEPDASQGRTGEQQHPAPASPTSIATSSDRSRKTSPGG
jgi:hypothetical protein